MIIYSGGGIDIRFQSGIFFGFISFWLGWEMIFFLRERFNFARQREILFFGVFWCFLFWGVFVLFGVFFVFSRVSAKKKNVFFRRWHEQNREFPLCPIPGPPARPCSLVAQLCRARREHGSDYPASALRALTKASQEE